MTLYAKWTQIYNVTFNLNYDGETETTTPDAQTIIAGNTATEPESPVRAAYNFTGWYTDIGCTDAYDFSNVVEADITLYAGWEIKTYTVNFYNEYTYSDTYLTICSLTIEHGESIAAELLSTYIPNEVGSDGKPYYPNGTEDKSKTFDGWYTDSNFTTKFEFGSAITCNMDIYANWVDVNVTIKLDLNDGTLYDNTFTNENKYTATVVYGSTVDIADPVKSENEFLGWYTDENCTEVFILDTTTVTANITLYAGWECTQATINGVIYTKTTNSTETNGGTITFGSTIMVDSITKYWVVTGYTDLSAYYGDTWLVLENEIYGYPVLEIAAGALANTNGSKASADNSLTNVLVPENIVMVGSRAFLDNKGITSIVFLADEVYFSRNSSESYANNNKDNYYNGVESGGEHSKNFPFYGCGTNSNNTATNLTVYYKTAYSTNCTVDNTITLDGGVFVIGKNGSSYVRTNNDTSTTSSSNIQTITWLYIDTTTISQSLVCGEYDRGDFDWASALTDAVKDFAGSDKFNISHCCYGDYVFIATDLTTSLSYTSGGETITSTLSAYIADYLENAINSFTAEYGEYINGYKVSSIEACTSLVNGNDVTFKIGTDTIYYLLDVNQSVVDGSNAVTSAGWDIVKGVNNDGGTIVTYSVKVGDTNATAVTMEVTYSGSVQYFDYDTNYSSYYSTTNSGKAVYGTGDITISGESGYNYKTDGCSLSNVSSVTEVALVWTQTDDPYIYIVSDIDFTYSDGTNTTYISASKTGSPLLYSHVNSVVGNSLLNGGEIDCSADGYYFLGWAYIGAYIDSDNNNALTFTTITANETTFDSASVYYAIWAYVDWSVYQTDNSSLTLNYTVAGDGMSLPTPTIVNSSDTVGTFVDWYTDEEFATSTSELASGNYTYYAKTAENSVTVNGVTYTFTNSENYSHSSTQNGTSLSGSITNNGYSGGYYSITAYDFVINYDDSDWLVLQNEINGYPVIEITYEAFNPTYNGHGYTANLKNVIIPENIIYLGTRAFGYHTSLLTIVILADTVYLDNDAYTTSNNGRGYYPFFMGQDSPSVTIYINNYVEMSTTNAGVAFTCNGTNSSSGKELTPVTYWLYIDTAIDTTTIAGSTFELDNALIAALEDYATTNSITYYQNGDYLFIAASSEDLINSVTSYITGAIDDFSAQYGSYINGHTVEVETDESDGNNIIVNIADNKTDGNSTAYYRISEDIQLWDSETEEYGSWAASSVSYSEIITENGTSAIDVTYTIDGATLYAAYSAAEGSFEIYGDALYIKNGTTLTITADNYSYELAGLTYNGTADEVTSGQSCSVTTADGAYTLTVEWNAVDKGSNTVTVYSDIAFTLGDNTATIAEKTKETVALDSENDTLDSMEVVATKSNYYFLGWAYMADTDEDGTGDTLTFTSGIKASTTDTYYAIWGYNENVTLSNYSGTSGETALPTTLTGSSGSFYAWYTEYDNTKTYEGNKTTLDGTTYTTTTAAYSYITFSGEVSNLIAGTYTYYARMEFKITLSFSGKTSEADLHYTSNDNAGRANGKSCEQAYLEGNYIYLVYSAESRYSKCNIYIFESFETFDICNYTSNYSTYFYAYVSYSNKDRFLYVLETDFGGKWDNFVYCCNNASESNDTNYRIGQNTSTVSLDTFTSFTVAKGNLSITYKY